MQHKAPHLNTKNVWTY